ncbi:enoyl-CoA hydratase-related protein [Nitratireductor alexandrii]|uniref:enoyl-CoA hydratase-related protein n=1 Tax=Nitratireductor alexandrii TaxID=2448161 RepID=UPI000FD84679|nr:enoyl-CoA hydratase-related protein [Nitratireductor alexandrii]
MNDAVLTRLDAGVLTITMNRPDRMNAWNGDIEEGLRASLAAAVSDPEVRVVVITGAGRAFCAGADTEFLKALQDGTAKLPEPPGEDPWPAGTPEIYRGKFSIPAAVPKPVIAAVDGPAVGIGYVLSLFCDIRIASDRGAFIGSFSRMGLIAEKGIDWALTNVVGQARAMEILLSGRKVGAEEALRIGLVTQVLPVEDFAASVQAYAAEMATAISPRSAAIIKRQVQQLRFDDIDTVMARGERELAESLKSADFREAMAAMKEKRPAAFPGLGS